jgi:hypothetical protein
MDQPLAARHVPLSAIRKGHTLALLHSSTSLGGGCLPASGGAFKTRNPNPKEPMGVVEQMRVVLSP